MAPVEGPYSLARTVRLRLSPKLAKTVPPGQKEGQDRTAGCSVGVTTRGSYVSFIFDLITSGFNFAKLVA